MRSELYIDGKWVKPSKGGTCIVTNPATEETIQTISAATAEDVDVAVKAARRAFDKDGWPKLSGAQRAKYLRAIAAGIRVRQADIARLEVLDNGKPFPEADWDVADAAGCFDFYAGLAEQLGNETGGNDFASGRPFHIQGGEGAHRRRRCNHPLELSAADGSLEGCSCSCGRVHGCSQASRADVAHSA